MHTMNRWKFVFLGIVIMMLLGTVYSYSVFRLSIENVFRVGTTESGMPYMMALAFYAFFMFLTGKYLDRFDPKIVILIGGLIVSIGWILSSFVSNIFLLMVTYGCISGAGVGIVYGVPMTVVAKWFPDKKGFAVGLVLIGFGLSPLIMAPVGRALIEYFGLMSTFRILGITIGLMITVMSMFFKYPTELEIQYLKKGTLVKKQMSSQLTKEMIHTKSFKGLYLNFIIGTMVGLMLIGMTATIAVEFAGIDVKMATQLLGVFALFNGLGRPIFGWLTDQLGVKKAMLLSYFMISLAALLLMISENYKAWIFVISFSVFWFNMGGWVAIAPATTLRLFGIKHYSQNYGLVFTAYGIGAIAGVSTSGILLDIHGNYYLLFVYVIALCVLGSIITMKYLKEAL